ncbi:hypothetical protein EJ04DRAFT_549490 [Polyplosphaeria fusca]|uniref:Uncharacterized protein n=1 Tax=Polyplosphaeria fusca TaxID=682080 RepID=A0A9P4V755_9PLEO|nr:hypothetical protein EJ04DRAFT_549490 [Polyplosphaeria fusca]
MADKFILAPIQLDKIPLYILGDHSKPRAEELGVGNDNFRHRVVMYAGQTGDVAHVAGALVLDPDLDVLILSDPNTTGQAQAAFDTFKNAVDATRIEISSMSKDDCRALYDALLPSQGYEKRPIGNALWRGVGKDSKGAQLLKQANMVSLWSYERSGYRVEYPTVSVGGTTSLIASKFKAIKGIQPKDNELYKTLSAALSKKELTEEAIATWWTNKFEKVLPWPKDDKKEKDGLLLVWSRYTGHNVQNGHNPEGDSDPEGQLQLITMGRFLKYKVVTIGHDTDPEKWVGRPFNPKGDLHLGEFWREPTFKFKDDTGRASQTSLYVNLAKRFNVVQVGQKTGGMDNAALVGIPTIYIEDKRSPTSDRMKKWADVMTLYESAMIELPPTLDGKTSRTRLPEKNFAAFRYGYVQKQEIEGLGKEGESLAVNDGDIIFNQIKAMIKTAYPPNPWNKPK